MGWGLGRCAFHRIRAGPAGIGEGIDAALNPDEPVVDVAQQDLGRIWPRWRSTNGRCASERLLTIGGHDGLALAAPRRDHPGGGDVRPRFWSDVWRRASDATAPARPALRFCPMLRPRAGRSRAGGIAFSPLNRSPGRDRAAMRAQPARLSLLAAERSTACSTRSRVKVSLSSPMITAVGSPSRSATRSQQRTSTPKPNFSRKRLTGRCQGRAKVAKRDRLRLHGALGRSGLGGAEICLLHGCWPLCVLSSIKGELGESTAIAKYH